MYLNFKERIGVAGACLIVSGILIHFIVLPLEIKSHVKRKHALKRGWMMRDLWGRLPFSFDLNFYLFNVTNPNDIAKGERPLLHEVGPYVYDEWQEKTYQKDHDDDDTVSFKLRNTYYFNPEKSNGLTGEEELIVPNYFILGLVNIITKHKPEAISLLEKAVDQLFDHPESIFVKAKAKDILFTGLIINCTKKEVAASLVCSEIHSKYEEMHMRLVSKDIYSMSLWGGMNATDTKRIRVYRGYKNLMDVGKVVEYDKKPNISVWKDEYCDKFNGTDGTVFHPFFNKKGKDDLVIFSPHSCRNVYGRFESKTKFAGMKLLRYSLDVGTDGAKNPRERCYCEAPNACLKKGVFDLWKCNKKPVIVSNPHFYLADPFYLNNVAGLDPDKEKHQSIIDIEPFSGTPVQVHFKLQTNMFINPVEKFKLMKNFREALLPVLWFEESMVLPNIWISELKNGHRTLIFATFVKDIMILSGLCMCGYYGYKHFMAYRAMEKRKRETRRQNTPEEPKRTSAREIESRENEINNNMSAAHHVSVPVNRNDNNNNHFNNNNNNNPINHSTINHHPNVERLPPIQQPINAYALRPNTVPPSIA